MLTRKTAFSAAKQFYPGDVITNTI